MPFESKAQARWMFAEQPEMAKRWAAHTKDIKDLPDKKRGEEVKNPVEHTVQRIQRMTPQAQVKFAQELVRLDQECRETISALGEKRASALGLMEKRAIAALLARAIPWLIAQGSRGLAYLGRGAAAGGARAGSWLSTQAPRAGGWAQAQAGRASAWGKNYGAAGGRGGIPGGPGGPPKVTPEPRGGPPVGASGYVPQQYPTAVSNPQFAAAQGRGAPTPNVDTRGRDILGLAGSGMVGMSAAQMMSPEQQQQPNHDEQSDYQGQY